MSISSNSNYQEIYNKKPTIRSRERVKKKDFEQLLEKWYIKWELFLKERTFNPETNKYSFTHKRLRSAYRSLTTNSKYLFTYKDNDTLNMPNTSNSIEGMFSSIKNKLRNHAGLKRKRKIKFLDYLLSK